jgi:transcription factor CRZ1
MAGQVDWSQTQFQGHRRSPSEYSDVSSAAASPNLGAQDSFEPLKPERGHSPMQRPQDGFYDGVNAGLGSFSISDQLAARSRSPSHSPAISPRIAPQQLPDMGQGSPGFAMGGHPQGYLSAPTLGYGMPQEQFPALGEAGMAQQMATPSINIDFAPNSRVNSFEPNKPQMDQDSLTPPDRGMA